MINRLPHPIPYQGSKRRLAPLIAPHIPQAIDVWFEPFVGSGAMTIWAAHHKMADRYVISDVLMPLTNLWETIVDYPEITAERYALIWRGQETGCVDYFNHVRERYNSNADPVDLLYLICRCVKNAVRFNSKGRFTQSVDKRRLGMSPDKMHSAIRGVSKLLRDRIEIRSGDWRTALADATSADFVYLDPPYLGTTLGKDKRYAAGLEKNLLIEGIADLRTRNIPFALSYDGMTGARDYGPPLPDHLGLTRLLFNAGRSSQATLSGRNEDTIESLYLPSENAVGPSIVIQNEQWAQESFAL